MSRSCKNVRQLHVPTGGVRMGLLLIACVLANACDSPPHRTQKIEAERQWNKLRSQVKGRLAVEQFNQGRLDDAIATLNEAIQLNPTEPAFHRLSARCSLEKGKMAAAVASLDIAASLGDESADLSYLRGLLAERRGQFESATEHYSQAWSLDPDNVDHLIALAESLIAVGRPADAAELLKTHAPEFDNPPKILMLRAHVYSTVDEPESAAADYADVMQNLQDPTNLLEPYALVLVRLGRYAEARTLLQRRMDETENSSNDRPRTQQPATSMSASAARALAQCYIETHEPARARRLLDDYLRDSPTDARAWWLLAEAHVELGDFPSARRAADQGRHIRPDLSHWGLLDAYIAWRTGDVTTAAASLQSVVADHPENALAHSFLVTLLDDRVDAPEAHELQFVGPIQP